MPERSDLSPEEAEGSLLAVMSLIEIIIGEADRRMPGFAASVADTIDAVRPRLNWVSAANEEHPLSRKTRDGTLEGIANLLRQIRKAQPLQEGP